MYTQERRGMGDCIAWCSGCGGIHRMGVLGEVDHILALDLYRRALRHM
jgi:hypothetical protein